jgi:hypothetical protein
VSPSVGEGHAAHPNRRPGLPVVPFVGGRRRAQVPAEPGDVSPVRVEMLARRPAPVVSAELGAGGRLGTTTSSVGVYIEVWSMPAKVSGPVFGAVVNFESVCCCQKAGAHPAAAQTG